MSLDLQKKLMEFAPYNIDFKIQDGWFIIGIEYNPEWTVIKPQDNRIEYLFNNKKHYYGALLDNNTLLDDAFDLIRLTISYNKDLEKKVSLFQDKVKELQDIFSENEYDDLVNLEFKFKKKRKSVKKVEVREKEDEVINVSVSENSESNDNTKVYTDSEEEINLFE